MSDNESLAPAIQRGDEILARQPLPTSSQGLEHLAHPSSLIAGGLLGMYALKRRDLVGLFAAGIGAGLLYRGAEQNGLLNGNLLRRILHTKTEQFVTFERQLIIDRPPADVYRFWRNLENLAIFMPHIRDVHYLDDRRSRWQFKITDARYLEWTAELVEDEAQRLLVWRTVAPSDLHHRGWVHFAPRREGRSTQQTIRLHVLAPGGRAGARLVQWLHDIPARHFTRDLQHFRSIMESSAYNPDEALAPTSP